MNKLLLVLVGGLALAGNATAQKQEAGAAVRPGKIAESPIRRLLPAGRVQVAVMDSLVMPPRYMELSQKFLEGARANPEWFLEQQNKAAAPGGSPAVYDKRFGMTEPEFREFQVLMEKREFRALASYTGPVTVSYKGNTIRFAGTGKLAMLNEVWIDLARNEVHLAGFVLPYTEQITVDEANNLYQSAWSAYKWELAEPAEDALDQMSMEKLRTMTMTLMQFHVGTLRKNGKTFLKIKGSQIDKGVKKFGFDVPLFLQ